MGMNLLPRLYRLRQWAAPERWQDADKVLADEVLQQLLLAPASAESWQALLELFAVWPTEADVRAWVQWLEPLITHWPAEMRTSVLGQAQTRAGKSCVFRLLARLDIERIDDDSGMRLIGWSANPDWSNLQSLSLYKVESPASQLGAFLAGAGLRQLQHLELRSCPSLGGHLNAFFAAQALPPLQKLGLIGCDLAASDLDALAHSAIAASLLALELSGNFFGAGAVVAMLEKCRFARLERLVLNQSEMDAGVLQQWLLNHQHARCPLIQIEGVTLSATVALQ